MPGDRTGAGVRAARGSTACRWAVAVDRARGRLGRGHDRRLAGHRDGLLGDMLRSNRACLLCGVLSGIATWCVLWFVVRPVLL